VTPYPWPLCSYLELGALPTAVACARLHARHLMWEWGLNGLAADIELLTSELVTNAVKATAGRDDRPAVRLQLSSDRTRVVIEVWDADPRPPAPMDLGEDGTPDTEEEGGRGLFLVAALSTRWDWYLTREPAGKFVWCEVKPL
jgi:anti-sigma regulatory factor (Ser/Thr protein kinase)